MASPAGFCLSQPPSGEDEDEDALGEDEDEDALGEDEDALGAAHLLQFHTRSLVPVLGPLHFSSRHCPFAVLHGLKCRMQTDACRVVLLCFWCFFFPFKSCAFGSSGAWQPRQVYFCWFIFILMLLAPLLTLAATLQRGGVERCSTASPSLCVGSSLQGVYLLFPIVPVLMDVPELRPCAQRAGGVWE